VRTVQGEVETALSKLFDADVFTVGAGRTDAGVHALGQVMTTSDAPDDLDTAELQRSLNAMCGPAIAFTGCTEAAPEFHARFSAHSRTYVYAVLTGEIPDPFLAPTALYHPGSLDMDVMNEAAGHLLGPRDFSSFGRVAEPEASAERTLFELSCTTDGRLAQLAHSLSYIYVVLAWVGLYLGVKYYRQLQDETQRALAARGMAHQAQLKMLRYQLNPHFLFNTLNAISTLILDRDGTTANRMVQGLSAFLRHSLDNDPMQRVTLKQELDALNLYLGIEKVRFTERLRMQTEVEPECWSALVPSLILQPLVENAIKYAVSPREQGGQIRIGAHVTGTVTVTVSKGGS
jgi:tRNA pseudouridine(38-40) synthase